MKYLITNPDSFGDIVLRQPLFTQLIDAGHEVGVLVKRSYSQIVHFLDPRLKIFMMDDMNPYVISILDNKQKVDIALDQVEQFNPDVVVIAPYQRTVIDNWTLTRFAHKRTIGMKGIEVVYENERRVFRPASMPIEVLLHVPENLQEVEKNKRLLALCLNKDVSEYLPHLQLPEATLDLSKTILKQLLLKPDNFIICAPASSSVLLKQYPIERYIRVLSYWAKNYNQSILLVGNEFEKNVISTINDALRNDGIDSRIWIGNETNLEVLLGLISQSRVYFGNDTGTMHFAAALGKPVIAIFGGGHWPRFSPTATSGAVILKELPCFGCGWQCIFKVALCIHSIDERRVIETVDKFEEKKLNSFKVFTEPFDGNSVTAWIQEAKTTLKEYKEQLDIIQISKEKEKVEFVKAKDAIKKEADEAHKHVAKLRTELDEIYKKLSEKNHEIQHLHSELHNKSELFEQEKKITQMYQSQLNEKDRQINEQAVQIQHLKQEIESECQQHKNKIDSIQKKIDYERSVSDSLKSQLAEQQTQIQNLTQQYRKEIDLLKEEKKKLDYERSVSDSLKSQLAEQQTQIQNLTQQYRKEIDLLKEEKKKLDYERSVSDSLKSQLAEQQTKIQNLIEQHNKEIDSLKKELKSRKDVIKYAIDGLIDIKSKLEEMHLSFRQEEEAIKHLENSLFGIIKSGWVRLGINIGIPWLSRWYKGLFAKDKETGKLIILKPGWDNPLRLKENITEKINDLLKILNRPN